MTHPLFGCVVDMVDLGGGLAPRLWGVFADSMHPTWLTQADLPAA
jgi:hypothetical protein